MNQAEVAFPAPRSSFYSSSRPSHFVFVEWFRSASRASIASKGVDLRIEELKTQNKQLLEELFALRKACESKDEELTEFKEKVLQCSVTYSDEGGGGGRRGWNFRL